MAMDDAPDDDEFDSVLAEARALDDLSRENVARLFRDRKGTVIPEGAGLVNWVVDLWFCWLSASV